MKIATRAAGPPPGNIAPRRQIGSSVSTSGGRCDGRSSRSRRPSLAPSAATAPMASRNCCVAAGVAAASRSASSARPSRSAMICDARALTTAARASGVGHDHAGREPVEHAREPGAAVLRRLQTALQRHGGLEMRCQQPQRLQVGRLEIAGALRPADTQKKAGFDAVAPIVQRVKPIEGPDHLIVGGAARKFLVRDHGVTGRHAEWRGGNERRGQPDGVRAEEPCKVALVDARGRDEAAPMRPLP